MIMIDPSMMTGDIFSVAFEKPSTYTQVLEVVRTGKDARPPHHVALEWYSKWSLWKQWNPRALHLLVVSAIYTSPAVSRDNCSCIETGVWSVGFATCPDREEGITRTCMREQVADYYLSFEDVFDSLSWNG
jgi:hypothetical protein